MTNKMLGYIFLGIGVLIMIFSTVFTVLVFTGGREPIKAFSLKSPSIPLDSLMPKFQDQNIPGLSSVAISSTQSNKSIEIMPGDQFSRFANMGATILLMGFLVNFGFKISSLGVNLLKEIKAEVKQSPIQPQNQP